MSGRLVGVFAIDLVPELVCTGRAHEEVSAVAPKPSRCRIADHRRTRKSPKEIREAVSDRGGGVRGGGERPPQTLGGIQTRDPFLLACSI